MALSVVKLRREYEIRLWTRIIEENRYIAVVQLAGGQSWGRSNMKSRILGEYYNHNNETDNETQQTSTTNNNSPIVVNARYAVPRAAREGARRSTRYAPIANLFRTASCAVVYGTQVAPVAAVVKNATKVLKSSLLVGGRFGEDIVTAGRWAAALDSDGEAAEFARLIATLDAPHPALLQTLDSGSRGLATALDGAGAKPLVGVLQQIDETHLSKQ